MKINEFFQKGYYINLDRRADRRTLFEKEVKDAGLQGFFERVPGIDAKAIVKDTTTEEGMRMVHNYCGETFANIFKKAEKEGYERFLILEDDAQFYNANSLKNIENALDQLQNFPDWDTIYLGCYVFDNPVQQVSENLLKCEHILANHATGFNRKGLKMFLQYDPHFHCPVDTWLGERGELNKYVVYPLSVIQRQSPSDLDINGFAPTPDHWETNFIKSPIVKKF